MDDHNFMLWSHDHRDTEEPNYDDIIENDAEIDDLNELIEEQVEGYEEVNMLEENSAGDDENYYIDEEIMPEKYTQENLIYLTDDGIIGKSSQIGVGMSHLIEQRVQEAESKIIGDQDAQEEFTAEVITEEDWIQSQGEDMVPVAMEQIVSSENYQEDDVVPLQTDQDEYTTQRPYPCDFCSRRFRKKANLQNHMIAHRSVRNHMCNLCGSRYVRKCDLINHLKIHAYNIEDNQLAGPSGCSTGGKKKPPDFDDLAFSFNDTFDDDDIPDDDEFINDYNHYSKPSVVKPLPKITKSSSKTNTTKKTSIKKSKSSTSTSTGGKSIKFERNTKEKPTISITNQTISNTSASIKKEEYVEKFPILDPRKPFVCQSCGVQFTREKALESHMKHAHTNQEPTFDCEVCGDSFFDNASLEEHLELRHNYSSRIRKSTGGKTTSGKVPSRASQMLDFEDSEDNSEYEPEKDIEDDEEFEDTHGCDKCEMTFKNAEGLKRHIKTHFIKSEILSDFEEDDESGGAVKSETNLGCNVCGESFTEALDLLAHAEIHARFQPFKCLLCGETFFEENKIKMHLMENHRGEMTESSCKLCGKQCRDQRSLIKHSWEHSREKNHSCSKCGKTFHNKARLKRHIASHRNKSVVCEICHEEFSDGRQLMNHRHSHTKSNQFPCTECGKTFGSRSSQQIHIRIHTGERPYSCRFCWKAFADGGTLRKHERIHTGEKPYCCLVCPRAFNQRVVLREHIRSHHSAPDPEHGTTLTPYYCTLCGELFAVSLDLIHHLIEHSDRSTAAKRVQPTGPRKYKRRRKLNDDDANEGKYPMKMSQKIKQEPTETDTIQSSSNSSVNNLNKSSNKKGLLTTSFESYVVPDNIVEFRLPEEIFQTVSRDKKGDDHKKHASSSSSRPKMIFTEKTRVPVYDGKRKTRTMIQKQVLNQHPTTSKRMVKKFKKETIKKPIIIQQSQQQYHTKEDNDDKESTSGSETCSNDDEDVLHALLKRERKLSEKFTVDLVNDLQEILMSPIKTSLNEDDDQYMDNTSSRRRRTISRYSISMTNNNGNGAKNIDNQDFDEDHSESDEVENIIIKQEVFNEDQMCTICGCSFSSRDQLLEHVSIHI